jgi:hypothetical protein
MGGAFALRSLQILHRLETKLSKIVATKSKMRARQLFETCATIDIVSAGRYFLRRTCCCGFRA